MRVRKHNGTEQVAIIAASLCLLSTFSLEVRAEPPAEKPPRFGIYMPKLDVYTQTDDVATRIISYERSINLADIPLAEHPIISEDDLLSYDWETHTLHLKKSAWWRVHPPSSHGLPFVVVVDGAPIYVGAFWTQFSSIPSEVPVIIWDYEKKATDMPILPRAIKRDAAPDPRDNRKLKAVLKALDKLKTDEASAKR